MFDVRMCISLFREACLRAFTNPPDMTTRKQRLVHRTKLETITLKTNTDGNSLRNFGLSEIGGLIQDELDRWIVGFFGSLGISTNMHANLAAIYQGLKIAANLGEVKAMCLIKGGDSSTHVFGALLEDIR